MSAKQWDWIARPEHYRPRKVSDHASCYGVVFNFSVWTDGPPGWPCKDDSGMTANPGSTWYRCNACGGEVARVQNGGDGDSIEKQKRAADRAFEFHRRNCDAARIDAR